MNIRLWISAALIMATSFCGSAAETGDLKIKFKFKGDKPPIPAAVKIPNPGQNPFCGNLKMKDTSLLVNPENKGIANIVVYVYTGRGSKTKLPVLPPHQPKQVTLANEKCMFVPRVVLMQAGDTLVVTNPDPVGHNAKFPFFENKELNFQVPAGQKKQEVIAKAEPAPTPVECGQHTWMKAYVLVTDNPYAAISDEDGELTIKGLPEGEKVEFRAWHERATFKNQIFINGKEEKWKLNRFEVKIKAGENDLGTVEVPAVQIR